VSVHTKFEKPILDYYIKIKIFIIQKLKYYKEIRSQKKESVYKMINNIKSCLLIFLFIIYSYVAVLSSFAEIPFQKIYIIPEQSYNAKGSNLQIKIFYDVSDKDNTLTGIGFYLHYDSTKLNLLNASHYEGSLSEPEIENPYNDEKNLDNDPKTDKLIAFTWMSLSLYDDWPGMNVTLPLELASLNFLIREDCASGETNINITRITHSSASHQFVANNSLVNIEGIIKGDSNKDGIINLIDLNRLIQFINQ